MPQSSISITKPFTDADHKGVGECLQAAVENGLTGEFMEWYTNGILQGLSPAEAATQAAWEWDL